jgi:hypothetical protein
MTTASGPTRVTPWHDTEDDLRAAVATVEARGHVVYESEAWALGLALLRRVIPDVDYREIGGARLADVGDASWLEYEATLIVRRRAERVSREDYDRRGRPGWIEPGASDD